MEQTTNAMLDLITGQEEENMVRKREGIPIASDDVLHDDEVCAHSLDAP